MNVQKIEQYKQRPQRSFSRWSLSSLLLLVACFYVINSNSARAEVLYITPAADYQAVSVIDSDQPNSDFDAPSMNSANIMETLNVFMAGSAKMLDSVIDSPENDAGLISMDVIPAGTSGTVTVPVKINQAESIGTATIHVHYDTSSLLVLQCTMNPEQKFDSALCNKDYESSGVIAFNIISTEGFTGDATVAEIQFQIIDTLNHPFAPKLAISRSVTDDRGVDVPVSIAEVNQDGVETDTLSELLDGLLQVFLPIVQK